MFADRHLEEYPEHYSEHYVDIGLASTDAILRNAFNFDITHWKHSLSEGWPFGHFWPLNWYKNSVTTSGFNYGYPLSLEGVAALIDSMNWLTSGLLATYRTMHTGE